MSAAAALRRIEAELRALAEEAEIERIDAHALRVIARKIEAQAEMIEKGLTDGA